MDIKEIKARAEEATPGPWEWKKDVLTAPKPHYVVIKPWCDSDICKNTVHVFDNDADFIAHARTDIPALITEVERLQQIEAAIGAPTRRLVEENQRLQAELTAAVEDLKAEGTCYHCKHYPPMGTKDLCIECSTKGCHCNWEWRGVKGE